LALGARRKKMSPFKNVTDKVSFFFEDPITSHDDHAKGTYFSVLYLLRRELIETIGYDPNVASEEDVDNGGSRHRLFASIILMFTTIDLLAKFMLGDSGSVSSRFKKFLRSPDGGGETDFVSDLLWAIRNSMVHAFGLPDVDELKKLNMSSIGLGQRKENYYKTTRGLTVAEMQGEHAIIYVDGLFRTTKYSIQRYRDTLYGSMAKEPLSLFEAAFDKYGKITFSYK
jgi:hypothetical protein